LQSARSAGNDNLWHILNTTNTIAYLLANLVKFWSSFGQVLVKFL
jgi:hypothetical protein